MAVIVALVNLATPPVYRRIDRHGRSFAAHRSPGVCRDRRGGLVYRWRGITSVWPRPWRSGAVFSQPDVLSHTPDNTLLGGWWKAYIDARPIDLRGNDAVRGWIAPRSAPSACCRWRAEQTDRGWRCVRCLVAACCRRTGPRLADRHWPLRLAGGVARLAGMRAPARFALVSMMAVRPGGNGSVGFMAYTGLPGSGVRRGARALMLAEWFVVGFGTPEVHPIPATTGRRRCSRRGDRVASRVSQAGLVQRRRLSTTPPHTGGRRQWLRRSRPTTLPWSRPCVDLPDPAAASPWRAVCGRARCTTGRRRARCRGSGPGESVVPSGGAGRGRLSVRTAVGCAQPVDGAALRHVWLAEHVVHQRRHLRPA